MTNKEYIDGVVQDIYNLDPDTTGRCLVEDVIKLVEEKFTSTNTGSPKLSGAVCRWCYGHKNMCEKCVFGSEFSPAAQHRASA